MPLTTINFDTGPATLLDIGELSYNGVEFSPLFETSVSGADVKDNAMRTVRYTEYTITADGYVTLPDGMADVGPVMAVLSEKLSEQGGTLTYKGRGLDITAGDNTLPEFNDVAWGPVPEILDFQPLGGGRSAKIKWQVKVRLFKGLNIGRFGILQFNYDTAVGYGEDGYSSLGIRGTIEVPMTRPVQTRRTLTSTVDDFRNYLDDTLTAGIDLSRFRVVRRNFDISRDKRTMEFDFECEEKPYMDLPIGSTVARGSYSVRPARSGMGLCTWLCTLRATYTVRKDYARRGAWFAFLALLRLRMNESRLGYIPPPAGNQNPGPPRIPRVAFLFPPVGVGNVLGTEVWQRFFTAQNRSAVDGRRAWLLDFSFDEGTYQDSKVTTFSATWRLVTTFSHILAASGLWKKVPERDAQGNNVWAIAMRDVQGSQSWLQNRLDPSQDIIVDFGF